MEVNAACHLIERGEVKQFSNLLYFIPMCYVFSLHLAPSYRLKQLIHNTTTGSFLTFYETEEKWRIRHSRGE